MSGKVGRYYIWRVMPDGEIVKVAGFAVSQAESLMLQDIQLKYAAEYLATPGAVPLDPQNALLQEGIIKFPTSGRSLPGFADDCLPDAWGQRLVAIRLGQRHLDKLTLLNESSGAPIGAIMIRPIDGPKPELVNGVSFSKAQHIAEAVWNGDLTMLAEAPDSLRMLVSGGSSVGGARPKLLVEHEGRQWIAKFNQKNDYYDVSGVEWAALTVAKKAGLDCPEVRLEQLGERRCLLVERFDIASGGGRHHMLTANAMLKDNRTQEDPHLGSYEDIAMLIRKHCEDPEKDLEQLLGQILLNAALKNTDDHLRNFSFLYDNGWRLSPAYDIVPGDAAGAYHQLTLDRLPFLPNPDEGARTAKLLGLPVSKGISVGQRVIEAMEEWQDLLHQAGVDDERLLSFGTRKAEPTEDDAPGV